MADDRPEAAPATSHVHERSALDAARVERALHHAVDGLDGSSRGSGGRARRVRRRPRRGRRAHALASTGVISLRTSRQPCQRRCRIAESPRACGRRRAEPCPVGFDLQSVSSEPPPARSDLAARPARRRNRRRSPEAPPEPGGHHRQARRERFDEDHAKRLRLGYWADSRCRRRRAATARRPARRASAPDRRRRERFADRFSEARKAASAGR